MRNCYSTLGHRRWLSRKENCTRLRAGTCKDPFLLRKNRSFTQSPYEDRSWGHQGDEGRYIQRLEDEDEVEVGTREIGRRLNSSHVEISYAVFCLKKKKNH
eukprot:TRINITY_DN16364_c0_g1_i1.p2 TRINITY_DN16364_c0_g1~~TRINITY_DN16364_c0_g1_i1.p2  ORF type:complete len:101 (+),score=2.28 TRINITY_DN16364_c0_g1_i1:1710-2012(+)